MRFIFPQNYNFKQKLFGFIDYSTIFINLIWFVIVFLFLNILFTDINIKFFLFILLCFPVFLFSVIGFNGENIVYVFSYIIKFILKQKLLFFDKNF